MATRKAKGHAQRIYSPYEFPCGLKANNRLVKAPLYEHLSDFLGGPPNAYHFALYSSWSAHDWGMVITGNVQISNSHLTLGRDLVVPEQLDEASLKPYQTLAKYIKGPERRTLAIMQLSHAGRQSSNFIGGRYPFEAPLAPSAIAVGSSATQDDPVAAMIQSIMFQTPKEMSHTDITEVAKGFVRGALLAHQSGFDGVELHVAHGYLLAQFVSPKSNKRKDEYSHRSENGLRLLHQIIDGIHSAIPSPFIIGVKLNASDYLMDTPWNDRDHRSINSSETRALEHVLALANWGTVDFIDISGGDYENPEFMRPHAIKPGRRQAFFARFSQQALKVLDSTGFKYPSRPAIMLTGGLRTPALLQSALQSCQTDMLGIGRSAVVCPQIPQIMWEYDEGRRRDGGDTLFGMEPDLSTPKYLERWPLSPIWRSLSKIKLVGAGLNVMWYTLILRRLAIAEIQWQQYPGNVLKQRPDCDISALHAMVRVFLWTSNPTREIKSSFMRFNLAAAGGLLILLIAYLYST